MKRLLAILLIASPLWGAQKYVTSTAGGTGDGSSGDPWTLAQANSSAAAGDTVNFADGTYVTILNPSNSGSAGSPIVFRSTSLYGAVLTGAAADEVTNSWATFQNPRCVTVSTNYIVLDGFAIRCSEYDELEAWYTFDQYQMDVAGNHNIVIRCKIGDFTVADYGTWFATSPYGGRYRGLVMAGSSNTVMHSRVRNCNMGVVFDASDAVNMTAYCDTIHSTEGSNIVIVGDNDSWVMKSLLIYGCVLDTSYIEDNIQINCDAYANSMSGVVVKNCRMNLAGENAWDPKGGSRNMVEGCVVTNTIGDDDGCPNFWGYGTESVHGETGESFARGIPSQANFHDIFRFNILYANSGGMDLYGGDRAYNNTFLNNRKFWNSLNSSTGDRNNINVYVDTYDVRVFNNIIMGQYSTNDNTSGALGPAELTVSDNPDLYLDYNLYSNDSSEARFLLRLGGGSYGLYDGLSAWQTGLEAYNATTGNEAHSIEADPDFSAGVSYPTVYNASYTYVLNESSPAIDAGGPVTTVNDAGGGSGTTLVVDDSWGLRDDWGIGTAFGTGYTLMGDSIKIGDTNPVGITDIDYDTHTLTLSASRTWGDGDNVFLYVNGRVVNDIGAQQLPPPAPSFAHTWFVSNIGDDDNSGQSQDSAWQTIGKVNAATWAAGDTVLFRAGDTFTDTYLTVDQSGAKNNHIVFGRYGVGANPLFDMATQVTGWTARGSIWVKYWNSHEVFQCFFNGIRGTKVASIAAINSGTKWFWGSDSLYTYDTTYTVPGIEVPYQVRGILSDAQDYITIDGIDVTRAIHNGIGVETIGAHTWEIKNLRASYNSMGIYVAGDTMTVENCRADHNGYYSQEHGIYMPGNNVTVSRCTADSNAGAGIHQWTGGSCTITRNLVYDNGTVADDGWGIVVWEADAGTVCEISYNLVYRNSNYGIVVAYASGTGKYRIYNNTVTATPSDVGNYTGIFCVGNAATDSVWVKNNISYSNSYGEFAVSGDGVYAVDYNLWYRTGGARMITYGGNNYTQAQFAAYQSASGQDAHSLSVDPALSGYLPVSSSPSVDAGVSLGFSLDLAGNSVPYNDTVDIGAYEFIGTIPSAPTVGVYTLLGKTSFTANWGSVSGATGYELDVATNSSFTSYVTDYVAKVIAGTSEALSGLTRGLTYYYRVRAYSSGGTSASSSTQTAVTFRSLRGHR